MAKSRVDALEIVKLIGRTPLYKLRAETGGAEVWIKLEGNNPGGSIKDRAAWGMFRQAEKEGKLDGSPAVVESTSGNTGIGLALIGRALGLRVILTMPESISVERRAILEVFGAELVLTPASEGMKGAGVAAEQLLASVPGAIMLDQFANPGNPKMHEQRTGPEILRQIPRDKKLAAFVTGFGTGGTVTGVGRALLKKFPKAKIIAVEPASSPLLTQGKSGPHMLQGIGANFVPKNLDKKVVSQFMTVTNEDAIATAKWLAAEEGLFSGITAGANFWAAMQIAEKMPKDSVVVTVQPDRGDKYLSVFTKE